MRGGSSYLQSTSNTFSMSKTSGMKVKLYFIHGIKKLILVTFQSTIQEWNTIKLKNSKGKIKTRIPFQPQNLVSIAYFTYIVEDEEKKFHSNTTKYTYFWVLVAMWQYFGVLTNELMFMLVGPNFSLKRSKGSFAHPPFSDRWFWRVPLH